MQRTIEFVDSQILLTCATKLGWISTFWATLGSFCSRLKQVHSLTAFELRDLGNCFWRQSCNICKHWLNDNIASSRQEIRNFLGYSTKSWSTLTRFMKSAATSGGLQLRQNEWQEVRRRVHQELRVSLGSASIIELGKGQGWNFGPHLWKSELNEFSLISNGSHDCRKCQALCRSWLCLVNEMTSLPLLKHPAKESNLLQFTWNRVNRMVLLIASVYVHI